MRKGVEEDVFIDCSCRGTNHTVRFTRWDDEDCMLLMEVCLQNYYGLFRRIWAAILYVLGRRPICGFTDVLWDRDEADQVRGILERFVQSWDRNVSR